MTATEVLVAAGYTTEDAARLVGVIGTAAQRGLFWAMVEATDRTLDGAPRPKPLGIDERRRLSELVAQKLVAELVAGAAKV